MLEHPNATTSYAVKPFTAEEKAWFDRASRAPRPSRGRIAGRLGEWPQSGAACEP